MAAMDTVTSSFVPQRVSRAPFSTLDDCVRACVESDEALGIRCRQLDAKPLVCAKNTGGGGGGEKGRRFFVPER